MSKQKARFSFLFNGELTEDESWYLALGILIGMLFAGLLILLSLILRR